MSNEGLKEVIERYFADNLDTEQQRIVWAKSELEPYTNLDYVQNCMGAKVNELYQAILSGMKVDNEALMEIISLSHLWGMVSAHYGVDLAEEARRDLAHTLSQKIAEVIRW